jgi:hypothetical protein
VLIAISRLKIGNGSDTRTGVRRANASTVLTIMRVVFILLFAAVVHVVGTDSSYKAFFVVIAFLIVLKTILGWRWIACSRATIARIANRLAVPEIGAGEIQGASSVGVEDVACRCKPSTLAERKPVIS